MYGSCKRALALATGALLVGSLLTACGSSSTTSSNSAANLTGQALVDAANKEGTLTWYTSYVDKETSKLIEIFNKTYPGIHVVTQQGTAATLTARLQTEQKGGSFKADLFQGDASYAVLLQRAGALQPYSPADAPKLPDSLGVPAGYANVDAVLTTVIAYNPQVLSKAGLTPPTTWSDLTKPEWRGKFSVDDTAVNLYESLIGNLGHEKAQQLVTAIGANAPVLTESHTQALTQVQSGEPMASISVYGYLAAKTAKSTPSQVAFVNPNPLPASPDLIDLVRNAPHPAAAELFMTWLLSVDGQNAIQQVSGRISLRTDVKKEATAWDPAKWTPAWSSPSASSATINTYQSELKQAFRSQ